MFWREPRLRAHVNLVIDDKKTCVGHFVWEMESKLSFMHALLDIIGCVYVCVCVQFLGFEKMLAQPSQPSNNCRLLTAEK